MNDERRYTPGHCEHCDGIKPTRDDRDGTASNRGRVCADCDADIDARDAADPERHSR